jgi:hypothetical protein
MAGTFFLFSFVATVFLIRFSVFLLRDFELSARPVAEPDSAAAQNDAGAHARHGRNDEFLAARPGDGDDHPGTLYSFGYSCDVGITLDVRGPAHMLFGLYSLCRRILGFSWR